MDIKELTAKALETREKYAVLEKKKYGRVWSGAEIMQGFVGDVGDLSKLIMAKEGIRDVDNVDEKLAHELADCLWCILVLSNKYGVDLEKSFIETMQEINKKISE